MNWKEFKDAVESQGVTDGMNIKYINTSSDKFDNNEFTVVIGFLGGVTIK